MPRPTHLTRPRRHERRAQDGITTEEYAVVTAAGAGLAGLLYTMLSGGFGDQLLTTLFDHVLGLLRRGRVAQAVEAYGGDLLPGTDSPALQELGEYVAVAVREALLADPEPGAVARYSDRAPYDTEVVEAALARLGGRSHPLVPLLKGRLAAFKARAISLKGTLVWGPTRVKRQG